MNNVCIVCGSRDNLNTSMNINIDNKKINIYVCDEHADDITPKIAKDCYKKMFDDFAEIESKALLLGYKLVPIDSVITETKCETNSKCKANSNQKLKPKGKTGDYVDGNEAERILQRNTPKTSGDAPPPSVARNSIGDIQRRAGVENKMVKIKTVPGAANAPITIPSHIIDDTGETTIDINKSFTDKDLQARFKEQCRDS